MHTIYVCICITYTKLKKGLDCRNSTDGQTPMQANAKMYKCMMWNVERGKWHRINSEIDIKLILTYNVFFVHRQIYIFSRLFEI